MTHSFLLEIGLEEMPAGSIVNAEEQFVQKVKIFLDEKNLSFENIHGFSTPRRLAIKIDELAEKQPDETLIVRGPAQRIAQDEAGNWTKAAIGFSKGQGGSVEDLIIKEDKGEPYVFIEKHIDGKSTAEILQDLPKIIKSIDFGKQMKWGNYSYHYIRPIHWLVALLDGEVVPFELFDIEAGRESQGHRFLGGKIVLNSPEEYEEKLETEYVIADRNKRKGMIVQQIEELADRHNWLSPLGHTDLLNEVVDLVEYPTAFYGNFSDSYLEVPEVVLESSMIDHQRYFPVRSKSNNNSLLPYFISVRNGNKDHLENVVKGNEKVLSARLADAKFFYNEDQKLAIADFTKKLKNVAYYENLGSIYEKQKRAENMTDVLADLFVLSNKEHDQLKRVASIYKFDLVTQIVAEFTSLQGTIGGIYALERGEAEEVAMAISEQYLPSSAGGQLPKTKLGQYIALIDKLDSLIQFFSIDLIPSGSNDPHALRRQAIGAVRLILELSNDQIDLAYLIDQLIAVSNIPEERLETLTQNKESLVSFILSRLDQIMQSEYGISYDVRQAALGATNKNSIQILNAAQILEYEKETSSFKEIVESITRVLNITKDQGNTGEVSSDLIETESERELSIAVDDLQEKFDVKTDAGSRYQALVEISPIITTFFDKNMVMVSDSEIKTNRLTLLHNLANIAGRYADFRKLVV